MVGHRWRALSDDDLGAPPSGYQLGWREVEELGVEVWRGHGRGLVLYVRRGFWDHWQAAGSGCDPQPWVDHLCALVDSCLAGRVENGDANVLEVGAASLFPRSWRLWLARWDEGRPWADHVLSRSAPVSGMWCGHDMRVWPPTGLVRLAWTPAGGGPVPRYGRIAGFIAVCCGQGLVCNGGPFLLSGLQQGP